MYNFLIMEKIIYEMFHFVLTYPIYGFYFVVYHTSYVRTVSFYVYPGNNTNWTYHAIVTM